MSILLKQLKENIADYFGSRKEFGCGVSAPYQKIAWLFRLNFELNPRALAFWQDLSNGFNEVRSVEKRYRRDHGTCPMFTVVTSIF